MNRITRWYDALVSGLVTLAGAVLAAICGLIAWDVVARNLGLQPPESTVALTEYALLYVTMAAAPDLVRSRGHVMVEILHRRLPASLCRALDPLLLLACAGVSLLIAGTAAILIIEAAQRGELDTRSFDISRAWLFLPLLAGFGLMGIEFLRLLARGESLERAGRPPESL